MMKKFVRLAVALALAAVIALPVLAQEKEKKVRKNAKGGAPAAIAAVEKKLEGLDLTAEQKTKIKDLATEYAGKMTEPQKTVNSVMTNEVRKAKKDAADKAKAEGKKGKEAKAAVDAAGNLTADAKSKLEAAQKELATLAAGFQKAVGEVLTAEQKTKAGLDAPAKGKKKNN
jgi:Spy/CpxP family protein refolding chaperone